MSKPKYRTPKGTFDILPEEQPYWEMIRKAMKKIATFYGFERIDTPIMEETELFSEGVGESTDIVQKEMFSFETKGGTSLTLRPENTASIARAFIEDGMKAWPKPIKLYYIGPMFRHEKPQRNRYRQFHQAGLEVLASDAPITDALIIHVSYLILKELGLEDVSFQVNSIGCQECREEYNEMLANYIDSQKDKLTPETRKKIKKNPLRVFDSNEPKDRRVAEKAPQIVDEICDECSEKFKTVLEYLGHLDIPYELNPFLVRGLDYYTRTVFEIQTEGHEEYDPKNSIGGGGRYDDLVAQLKGKDIDAAGVALGIERIIQAMKDAEIEPPKEKEPKVFLLHLGEAGRKKIFDLMEILREAEIDFDDALGKSSLKAQKKQADKSQIRLRLTLAQKEALEDKVILKDKKRGSQETIKFNEIPEKIKEKLNGEKD